MLETKYQRRLGYQKAYRREHRDKMKAYKKEYYRLNAEKLGKQQREYRKRNREKILERKRAYYLKNRTRICAQKKEYFRQNSEKIKEKYGRYYQSHKEALDKRNREWVEKHRDEWSSYQTRYRKEHLSENNVAKRIWKFKRMRNYDYDWIKKLIDSKCEVCGSEKNIDIDHDHNTNMIRGALCRRCNLMLGMVEDDVDLMHNAIRYLNKTNVQLLQYKYREK